MRPSGQLKVGVLVALGLVLYGWLRFPHVSLLSLAGGVAILLIYGVAAKRFSALIDDRSFTGNTVIMALALMAGCVFVGEVLLEYVVLPAANVMWGWVEFGLVFTIYFATGALCELRRVPLRRSVQAAVVVAMASSLLWYIAVLCCFFLFFGTERQMAVFSAEGNYEDFRKSGMSNFSDFIMEDFYGAGFFHLLLGPLVASVLAAAGALAIRWSKIIAGTNSHSE